MGCRRGAGIVAILAAMWALVPVGAPAAQEPSAPYVPPPPKAWILVDADTGAVLDAHDERVPVPPASTIKILTALIVLERLPPDDQVPISLLAEGRPARKINVKAGQVWDREDLLYSMMMVSANDAAVALAERVGGGTLDGYEAVARRTAEHLGLSDSPVLSDPSGLDDEFSRNGGSRISARDLAIVARAAINRPDLIAITSTPEYAFTGGDGIAHSFGNHNRFLRMYPGATGMKTGLTDLAGRCLVATATRDGRTMLAVLLDAPDIYITAGQLLDQGFAMPVAAQAGLDHLPEVVPDASAEQLPPVEVAARTAAPAAPAAAAGHRIDFNSAPVALGVFLAGSIPAVIVVYRRRLERNIAA